MAMPSRWTSPHAPSVPSEASRLVRSRDSDGDRDATSRPRSCWRLCGHSRACLHGVAVRRERLPVSDPFPLSALGEPHALGQPCGSAVLCAFGILASRGDNLSQEPVRDSHREQLRANLPTTRRVPGRGRGRELLVDDNHRGIHCERVPPHTHPSQLLLGNPLRRGTVAHVVWHARGVHPRKHVVGYAVGRRRLRAGFERDHAVVSWPPSEPGGGSRVPLKSDQFRRGNPAQPSIRIS
jgi:hypothetical protein